MDLTSLYYPLQNIEEQSVSCIEDNVENFFEVVPYNDDNLSEISYEYLTDNSTSDNPNSTNNMDSSSESDDNSKILNNTRTPKKNKKSYTDELCTKRPKTEPLSTSSFDDYDKSVSSKSPSTSDFGNSLPPETNFATPPQRISSSSQNHTPFRERRRYTTSPSPRRYKHYNDNKSETSPSSSNNRSFCGKTENKNDHNSDFPIPVYRGHQLLGDSQFVRFAEQILAMRRNVEFNEGKRRIGYCVSGQTTSDLEKRLVEGKYKLHDKVILLIGTNDLLQQTNFQNMCNSYENILSTLQKSASKIVLLTVPPIPRFVANLNHWRTMNSFNKFIIEKADGKNIFAVDLASHFVGYDNITLNNYYESSFHDGRADMLHLNRKGFKLLKAILNIHYFDEFY